MREIKFRTWDNVRKEMYHSVVYRDRDEYTGQKDKNGKDIYEGDILGDGRRVYEIKHCKHGYSNILAFHPINDNYPHPLDKHYNFHYGEWDGDEFEIIGNIHENPGLLDL
tara:strand:+ start:3122 stop:3451 length:330 start_codon:yes stop_codon:yes gene_type:complete